jgi:RNA polymerase sigma-70 factor (ECF subfamily)
VGERGGGGGVGPGEGGFEAFFEAQYRPVVGLAFVLVGRRSVAEDLAQDAFLAAYRRWDRIGGYDDPGAWVRHVVANMATSFWRRQGRELRALTRLGGRRRDDRDDSSTGDDSFWSAVRDLPRRQAQCVALRYLEDRSTSEIAAVLGISEATVRVHLHSGRQALAERLGEELDEEEGR